MLGSLMSVPEIASKRFVISISGRALFDKEESHAIFEKEGKAAYERHQVKNKKVPFKAGPAMALVQKFLKVNERLGPDAIHIEVVVISRDSGKTASRLFASMEHHGLPILRTILSDGEPSSKYIKALGVDLFLSSNAEQVRRAINVEKISGATIMPRPQPVLVPLSAKDRALMSPAEVKEIEQKESRQNQIRIAFDGDAVLFSDESEKQFAEGGLDQFNRFESENRKRPLPDGPMRPFLEVLHQIQEVFSGDEEPPVRTALITARGATVAERVLTTFSNWGISVNEMMFLAGSEKGRFVEAFGADLFFDDSKKHVENTLDYANAGHVPSGVRNEEGADERNFTGGGQELEAQQRRLADAPAAGPTDPSQPGDTDAAELPASVVPLRPRRRSGP